MSDAAPARPRWRRWVAITVTTVVALVVLAIGAWVLLLPDVEQAPLALVLNDPDVTVAIDGDVTIAPADGTPTGTVVFYPGAGVPPEAYLPTWAPVVETEGVRVIIPAMPLRLAVLDSNAAAAVRVAADDVDGPWWLGGHSLGGAMAASFLADADDGAWAGLVLWGAYPAGDGLADRDDLAVVSVSGSRDGLSTPAEIEASRDDLPTDAAFIELEGVNHAQFGAYGEQRGDGEATVDDVTARSRIAEATVAGLGG